MKGYISSLQSFGTVDGPGVRAVIFGEGCPLRCVYCHNPETWQPQDGHLVETDEIVNKILRLKPYIYDKGGVTFSGGEPLCQAKFFLEIAKKLKAFGFHIALDTAGASMSPMIKELIENINLVLLDIKFCEESDYKKYCNGSLENVLIFLDYLLSINKSVWIRQVIIPTINDTEENVNKLKNILRPYKSIIEKIELLPFRNLCKEKYKTLNLPFPLENFPVADENKVKYLESLIND